VRGASIRTPDQRLRVFVSSTLAELAEERAAVREAIERVQLPPVLFELGARPHPPRDLYRAYLQQSQIFVGIYWQRYGWVAPDETVSGLEDEYGLSGQMPRLLSVKAPAPDREERLVKLLGRIQYDDTASYKPFQTPEELARLVSADLALLLSERFMSFTAASDDHPLPATDRPQHNLPVQLTRLIGREAELSTVKRALADSRLVTLTGVGGAGKSRLALQAAGDLLKEYADGAWLVELAPLSEPERVPSAVASGLAIPEDPHQPLAETLAEQLRSRQGWACRARWSSRCRRLLFQVRQQRSSCCRASQPYNFSWNVPELSDRTSSSPRPIPRRWRRSSGGWTGSRWPLSWLRPGSR
jgi:Domain of unknown function (DUF4062)